MIGMIQETIYFGTKTNILRFEIFFDLFFCKQIRLLFV